MAEEQTVNITGKDIQSVAQKLEEFGKQLSPNEQIVIDWLLERAASAPAEQPEEAEVSGYLFSPGAHTSFSSSSVAAGTFGRTGQPALQPFNQTFNRAMGFGNAAGVTGSVRVGVRF
jgi:hypothetical protein